MVVRSTVDARVLLTFQSIRMNYFNNLTNIFMWRNFFFYFQVLPVLPNHSIISPLTLPSPAIATTAASPGVMGVLPGMTLPLMAGHPGGFVPAKPPSPPSTTSSTAPLTPPSMGSLPPLLNSKSQPSSTPRSSCTSPTTPSSPGRSS